MRHFAAQNLNQHRQTADNRPAVAICAANNVNNVVLPFALNLLVLNVVVVLIILGSGVRMF